MNEKPLFKLSVDTQTIIKIIQDASVGDLIPYHTLSEAINKDVTKDGYGAMKSARDKVLKEKSIVFGTVKGVGIKRLNDDEIVETSDSFIKQSRRKARKGLKTISCSNYEELDADSRNKHNMNASLLGFISKVTDVNSRNKIASLTLSKAEPPKVEDLARLFK